MVHMRTSPQEDREKQFKCGRVVQEFKGQFEKASSRVEGAVQV
jgi:hypothetical protein